MSRSTEGTLDPQGPSAETMADLWWIMLWLGTAVFAAVVIVLVVGLFRTREGSSSRDPDLSGRWFAVGGVALPAAIVLVVFAATLLAMRAVPDDIPPDALVVEMVGHQWWWEVHYPDEGITTANELHIPVGRPVAVRLTASDVIHSFWVPRLAGKMDMLPDGTTTLVLEADEPGEHHSQCAEFCGLGHANMTLTVVAEPEERFARWVAERRRPAPEPVDGSARRGLDLFLTSGCSDCHTIQGTPAGGTKGPDLTHLADRPTIGAGVLPNTTEHLADWITDARAIKPGAKMPASELSEVELDELLGYLDRLR